MLYIVATPIGNLGEITLRAIEVLKESDIIAAEDIRHSLVLLNHYGIKKPMISYQRHNEREQAETMINELKSGRNISLISDAGMPLISDPGSLLIRRLIDEKLEYTVISGPCAAVNALVLSGMGGKAFCMLGFLPEKAKEKQEYIDKYKRLECVLIIYTAPHDLKKDLAFLYEALGSRRAAAVREISKMHEQVVHLRLGEEVLIPERGEIVLVIDGAEAIENDFSALSIQAHFDALVKMGLDRKEAMKTVAAERKISKSEVYSEILTHSRKNAIIR